MNKIIYIILCSLLLATYGKGQNAEEFNQIYNKIYLEISQKDFERATAMADSLYNISETPIYRAKSLMLSASLFEQSGDLKKAINYAKRADKELEKSDNYIWKTRILGFLATQHRYLSLYKESENYVNQAIEQAKKIPDSQRAIITEGFLLQEKAFSESDKENYREALKFFEQTQEFLERANADQFLTLQNMQFTAQCHFELGEYDKAESNLDYILKNWGEMPDNYVKGLTYIGLGKIYITKKDAKKAKEALDNAQEVMKDSEYLVVQKSLWETTADYYSLTDEASKLKDAMSKRDSIVSLLSNSKLEYINNSYSDLKNKNEKTLKMSKGKNYIILFIGLLLLSGLVYIFWYKQKKKKEIAGIRSYVESLINQHKESLNSVSIEEEEEEGENEIQTQIKTKVQQDNLMTQETEMKISNHLKEFEKENLFLNGDISLSWLASYCKTNIKYLSHYIKVNKKKDFNNYINELRINYIIMKLINEPVYRKYKIATLAEEGSILLTV